MPHAGTHIKFALDIKRKYKINNLSSYLSGTTYPDSRYITKINRILTHDKEGVVRSCDDKDFELGWKVHLLCDRTSNQIIDETLPELFIGIERGEQGTEFWRIRAAILFILDSYIIKNFDLKPYLKMIDYVESPNNEPRERIREFYQIIKRKYNGKKEITIVDAKNMWLDFNVGKEEVDLILQKIVAFQKNTMIVKKIENIYVKMINKCI